MAGFAFNSDLIQNSDVEKIAVYDDVGETQYTADFYAIVLEAPDIKRVEANKVLKQTTQTLETKQTTQLYRRARDGLRNNYTYERLNKFKKFVRKKTKPISSISSSMNSPKERVIKKEAKVQGNRIRAGDTFQLILNIEGLLTEKQFEVKAFKDHLILVSK